MLFGRTKQLEKRLERLEQLILSLAEQKPEQKPKKSTKEEIYEKLDQIDRAMIEKRLRALERRLKHAEPYLYNYDTEPIQNTNPNTNFDIDSLLKNPMLRMGINTLLRNFNTSIDELKSNPEKLIEILETITNTLKSKKKEAEEKNIPFNPYDPNLFMKR